jgi:hypothetical protein
MTMPANATGESGASTIRGGAYADQKGSSVSC